MNIIDDYLEHLHEVAYWKELGRLGKKAAGKLKSKMPKAKKAKKAKAERRKRLEKTQKKMELRRQIHKLKIQKAALERSKASKARIAAGGKAKASLDKLSKLQMYKRSSAAKKVKGKRIYPLAKR